MDGTLAAIFLIASLTDMGLTDCPTGCLTKQDAPTRLAFQLAKVEFQEDLIGNEALIGYDLGQRFGPFQPTFGAAITDQNDIWIGAGFRWDTQRNFGAPFFVSASLLPGLHFQGDGPDLGGQLHFRSSLGVGFQFEGGAEISLAYDHRSNADRLPLNPGLETISLRVAFPM